MTKSVVDEGNAADIVCLDFSKALIVSSANCRNMGEIKLQPGG